MDDQQYYDGSGRYDRETVLFFDVAHEGAQLRAVAEAAQRLARGEDGTEKPLSLTASQLRRIAEDRPRDLSRYLDAARLDRFGAAFAQEIAEG